MSCCNPSKLIRTVGQHFSLLLTVLHHKVIVFYYGYLMGLGIIQLLVHDWSKFTPSEWFGYLQFNRIVNGGANDDEMKDYCFLHHQNRNPHHFEYWITCDRATGKIKPMRMPLNYVTEMIVDWIAANRVYNRGNQLLDQSRQMKFLQTNKDNIHPNTRIDIVKELTRLSTVFKPFALEKEFSQYLEHDFQ